MIFWLAGLISIIQAKTYMSSIFCLGAYSDTEHLSSPLTMRLSFFRRCVIVWTVLYPRLLEIAVQGEKGLLA